MITKAIVEEVVDDNHLKIRIPIYNKAADDSTATPDKQLTEAGVTTLPGIKTHYVKGDVVVIGFEEEQINKPIILGQLQTQNQTGSTADIEADSLKVNINYSLPTNTSRIKVGGISSDSSTDSSSITGEINQAILMVQQRIAILEKKLDYDVGDIYLTTRAESPTDKLYSGTWQEAANSFSLEFEGTRVPVYIWQKIAE